MHADMTAGLGEGDFILDWTAKPHLCKRNNRKPGESKPDDDDDDDDDMELHSLSEGMY